MLLSGAVIPNGNRGAAETRPEISRTSLRCSSGGGRGRALTRRTAALRPCPAWRRCSEGAARRAVTMATRPKDAARRLAAKDGAADRSPLSRSPRAHPAWGEREPRRGPPVPGVLSVPGGAGPTGRPLPAPGLLPAGRAAAAPVPALSLKHKGSRRPGEAAAPSAPEAGSGAGAGAGVCGAFSQRSCTCGCS